MGHHGCASGSTYGTEAISNQRIGFHSDWVVFEQGRLMGTVLTNRHNNDVIKLLHTLLAVRVSPACPDTCDCVPATPHEVMASGW